jgi:8-oxo-dGTP pyrophosphatase MutT (NUDIX family)
VNQNDHKGFVTTAVDVVHSWAMFRLLRRTIRGPRGDVFDRTYVSTPGAVGVVALTPDNKIILVSQYRSSFDDYVLEIPAGMRDVDGEDPARTAWRELAEETGYVPKTVEYLGSCLSSPGVTDSVLELFIARDVVAGGSAPEGPEEQEMQVLVIPFSEALLMVDRGDLTDAKSVVGILLAARRFHDLGI